MSRRNDLQSCPAELACWLPALFTRLGGTQAWFDQHVRPWLLHWEQQFAGWPLCGFVAVDQSSATQAALPADPARSGLGCLLPPLLASGWPADQDNSPALRLRYWHGRLRDWLWQASQVWYLSDAAGCCWDPARCTQSDWRQSHQAPFRWRPHAVACGRDPWLRAARGLHEAGIWRSGVPKGRWLEDVAGGPALLWPLAGRDLLAWMTPACGQADQATPACGQADRAGQACDQTNQMEQALRGLQWWGHVRPSAYVVEVIRGDGRLVRALPVHPDFHRAIVR